MFSFEFKLCTSVVLLATAVIFIMRQGVLGQTVCLANQTPCGSSCMYVEGGQVCLESGATKVVCGFNESLCASKCYKPYAGDTCHKNEANVQVCRFGEEPCPEGDGGKCYNPSGAQKCYVNETTGITVVCGYNQVPCGGTRCYNPKIGQVCF